MKLYINCIVNELFSYRYFLIVTQFNLLRNENYKNNKSWYFKSEFKILRRYIQFHILLHLVLEQLIYLWR